MKLKFDSSLEYQMEDDPMVAVDIIGDAWPADRGPRGGEL